MPDTTEFETMLREWIIEENAKPSSLSEMEQTLRRILQRIGNLLLSLWLMWLSRAYRDPIVACAMCGESANYVRQREACLHTMFGKVRYKRALYRCESCGEWHSALDEALGLRPNAMSAEVERLVAQLGVHMPFAQASALFEELTLVSVSDQSVDKATQAYGEAVRELEQEQFETAQPGHKPEVTPLRLYGSIDGGRVRTRAPQGEEQPWREVKTGAWYQARGVPPTKPDDEWRIQAHDISYYADICQAEDFGDLFWATGVARGAEDAAELIIVGDGAQWIWELVDLHFPNAIQIIDWFHACEYLMPVAKQAFDDKHKQHDWLETTRDALWQGDLETVIKACADHIQPELPAKEDAAQQAVTYYTNNQHRMNYEHYRKQGYQIGSGTIESAVKQIASQRLKVSGARWNLDSARSVAKARAAYLSDQWHDLAQRREHLKKSA
jgi:hypothetical protein